MAEQFYQHFINGEGAQWREHIPVWLEQNMAAWSGVVVDLRLTARSTPWMLSAVGAGWLFGCALAGYQNQRVEQTGRQLHEMVHEGHLPLGENNPYQRMPDECFHLMREAGMSTVIILALLADSLASYCELLVKAGFMFWYMARQWAEHAQAGGDNAPGQGTVPPVFREYLDSLGGAQ